MGIACSIDFTSTILRVIIKVLKVELATLFFNFSRNPCEFFSILELKSRKFPKYFIGSSLCLKPSILVKWLLIASIVLNIKVQYFSLLISIRDTSSNRSRTFYRFLTSFTVGSPNNMISSTNC